MDEQDRVTSFVAEHDLQAGPAYRILDLESEVGEIAKEAAESTDYGDAPENVDVASDEIGDALFALLALAESLDIDAGAALDEALAKYRDRLDETGTAASGE
ncbi:nucleotide pyrophosphohydrolase [Halostella sp. JP-L12]|uniref:MazG nucleotide pyrophosphohydrolase domain-containing protein n=1 Tax=Halostella TaxID=1843185 RepID=UPI000EF78FCE|nr:MULTISPECIES: MazG nucleotide pyrophosphohydrolase domain-containing protein [Halostella]NHN47801.1 nucleotide pyrophosphohydrolase [Halostella sp. JP-L12]